MTAEKYVNRIVKKIKCSKARRREIKQQLLSDIEAQVEQGESLESVLKQMGDFRDIVADFNESVSGEERKKYLRGKLFKILGSVMAALLVLAAGGYWFLPKSSSIEESKYFDKGVVEEKVKATVGLLDEGDYETLYADAIPQMQSAVTEGAIEDAKKLISDDWGKRLSFGSIYMVEITQGGEHCVVSEITVVYENVSVVYHLTYDEDMRLAGVYMR